ncbi:hypothetical protein JOD82_002051 [Paenibacillus sp. 1182]|nr:hypothetical protein [Paenibacillus sp. 1182]MBP1309031.1 hypothetical protein [Paenibacillus sp. 1182]
MTKKEILEAAAFRYAVTHIEFHPRIHKLKETLKVYALHISWTLK